MLSPRSSASLVALFLLAAGCSETPTYPLGVEEEPAEELESIPGVLEATNLLRSGPVMIRLVGWQTTLFSGLIGAEVLINGRTDPSDGALIVYEFQVLAVDGLPAFDGRLVPVAEGYLIQSGHRELRMTTLPEALRDHIGKRIWVTTMGDAVLRHGVLE